LLYLKDLLLWEGRERKGEREGRGGGERKEEEGESEGRGRERKMMGQVPKYSGLEPPLVDRSDRCLYGRQA